MKLVIDIDEDVRVAISRIGLLRVPDEMQKKVDMAIQHGKPLPKGHRFIDADEILNHAFITEDEEGDIFVQKYYCIKKEIVDNALVLFDTLEDKEQ